MMVLSSQNLAAPIFHASNHVPIDDLGRIPSYQGPAFGKTGAILHGIFQNAPRIWSRTSNGES